MSDSLLLLPLVILLSVVDSERMEALLEVGLLLGRDMAEVSWAIDGAGFKVDLNTAESEELQLGGAFSVSARLFEVTEGRGLGASGWSGLVGLELTLGGGLGGVWGPGFAVREPDDW